MWKAQRNRELNCKHVKCESLRNIQVQILSVVGHMVTILKMTLLLRYHNLYLYNIYNLVSLEISKFQWNHHHNQCHKFLLPPKISYPLQYSCLENSMDRGTWRATSTGSQRVRHYWATNTFSLFFVYMYDKNITKWLCVLKIFYERFPLAVRNNTQCMTACYCMSWLLLTSWTFSRHSSPHALYYVLFPVRCRNDAFFVFFAWNTFSPIIPLFTNCYAEILLFFLWEPMLFFF